MAALLTRFEHQTLPIMVRHGILQVGFWTTIVGRSEQHLTYLLAWESLAQRQEQWDAFESDAEWLTMIQRSHTMKPMPFVCAKCQMHPGSYR